MKAFKKVGEFFNGIGGLLIVIAAVLFLFITAASQAASDTWTGSVSSAWDNAGNWDVSVPSIISDSALLSGAGPSTVGMHNNVILDSVTFTGSTSYNLGLDGNWLDMQGAGILNLSGVQQTIDSVSGTVVFRNSAVVGGMNILNKDYGRVYFLDDSSASDTNIFNHGDGYLSFYDNSKVGNTYIENADINSTTVFSYGISADHAAILNHGTVNFNNADAGMAVIQTDGVVNFSGSSSASGSSIWNTGSLYFRNGSTAANASILNGDNLYFNNAADAGSASITNNSNAYFNGQSTAAFATVMNNNYVQFDGSASAGTAVLDNERDMNFRGASTASSASLLNNGYLDFTDSASAGSAVMVNNYSLGFHDDATAENAAIDNENALTFSENASAGTSRVQNNAYLEFKDTSTAGNASINNTTVLVFENSASAGNANIYSDNFLLFDTDSTAGNAAINNQNTLFFYDDSSAGSAWIHNDRELRFYGNATAGNAVIDNDFHIVFRNDSSAGSATIMNNNSLYFLKNSTADNATILNNGGVGFLNSSTAGNATIVTGAGHDLSFYNDSTGGTSRLITDGTGFTDFGHDNAMTMTVGSIEGSGTYYLGGLTLVTGSNNLDTTVSGVIIDGDDGGATGASLTKVGTGTFTMTGNNAYTGTTTLQDGTLAVGSQSALGTSNVVVNGGTLESVQGKGINVGGDYNQNGGVLKLDLSRDASDTLTVAGTATLGGTLSVTTNDGFRVHNEHSFQILSALGGVSGSFNMGMSSLNADRLSLNYGSDDVVLTAVGPSYASAARSTNGVAVGGAVDSMDRVETRSTLMNYMARLSDEDLKTAYEKLSPASLTAMVRVGFTSAQMRSGVVAERMSTMFGGSSRGRASAWMQDGPQFAGTMSAEQEAGIAKSMEMNRWGTFVEGTEDFGAVTGDGNAPGYRFNTTGMTTGIDYRFDKHLVTGMMFGYDHSASSQSTGTVDVSGAKVGFYTGVQQDAMHAGIMMNAGIDTYTTDRAALGGNAAGTTKGLEYSASMNLGYDIKMGGVMVSPFAVGQFTQVDVNAFSETGSMAPLSFGNQGEAFMNTQFGTEAAVEMNVAGIKFSPRVNAAWEHVFQGAGDSLTANMGTGSDFTVAGAALCTDTAVLGGGFKAELNKDINAHVDYQGKVGMTNFSSQSVMGGVNVGF